ncbi:MAG: mannose-1-phosphate guanylyltransferase/mannose-6-phosphate isomerase [Gammaproteobacteria bacterium]|nr:mannose-1-phosphate guanylyltransferase/mannose-6-phosphate isomerase [Gammaproteobacteria bacterium]
MKLIPTILAGGGGTRLWPLSRTQYPKQFLALCGRDSLLQQTLVRIDRSAADGEVGAPIVVCNEEHRFLVAEQARLAKVTPSQVILEPIGRNTAPALTAAALAATRDGGDALLLMMPADHLINDTETFRGAVHAGRSFALDGSIVTFGIVPDHPATGLGYIELGAALNAASATSGRALALGGFVEKPELALARHFVESGKYLWNSGIFLVRASIWLRAIRTFRADIADAVHQAVHRGRADGSFFRLDEATFTACPSDSVDYAVMERLSQSGELRGVVISLDAGWSDVGSWAGLWEVSAKDPQGNLLRGDVCAIESSGNLIFAEHRLVAAIGCNDLAIIETADAVLVAPRARSQEVKQIVGWLEQHNRRERLFHRRRFRPWGSSELLDSGKGFRVNRLRLHPGGAMVLQAHQHRTERWTVVHGRATITCGDEQMTLGENESTAAPAGVVHRIANDGSIPLELIEIQSGPYLGEEDTVRYEDI